MRMMEGNTNELPAIVNPKLRSKHRTAAVGEDRMYIAFLKLQRLLADPSCLKGEFSPNAPG